MFKVIIWFMKIVLEFAALAVFLIGLLSGPQIAAMLGIYSNEFAEIAIGLLTGATASAVLFGIPIVVININDNLAKSVDLLTKLEKHSRPTGFATSDSLSGEEPPRATTTQAA